MKKAKKNKLLPWLVYIEDLIEKFTQLGDYNYVNNPDPDQS